MGRSKKSDAVGIEYISDNNSEVTAPKKRRRKYEGSYVVKVDSFLNVRESAGKDQKVVGKLYNGNTVRCNGENKKDADGNIWLDIESDIVFGWCMLDFLEKV